MGIILDYILSPKLWVSLLVIGVTVLVWGIIKKAIGAVQKKMGVGKTTPFNVPFSGIKFLLVAVAAIIVLQINGINVTSLVAGLGVVGIVVGFALQDVLKDIVMGVNILWDGFFAVGDIVSYGSIQNGEVRGFSLKSTKIYDLDTGGLTTVSNRSISEITKVSDQLYIAVPTPYDQDHRQMREVMQELAERARSLENIEDCLFLGTKELGDSSIDYLIKIICPPGKKSPTRRAFLGLVQDVFSEHDIAIPYPQMDVHVSEIFH